MLERRSRKPPSPRVLDRLRVCVGMCLGWSLTLAAEAAPEELPEEPPLSEEEPEDLDPLFRVSLHGFAQSRSIVVARDQSAILDPLVSLRPSPRSLVQGNLQLQLKLRGDQLGFQADASLYGSTVAPTGLFLINEVFVEGRVGPARVLVGRRRWVFGSGLSINPTDVLNPQKDVFNPELQRTGALLLPMVDVTLGRFILTALASPRLETSRWALPTRIRFDETIYGLRVYFLVDGADVNVMYLRDQRRRQHLVGLAGSRFLGDFVELHAEGLLRGGAPELPPVPYVPGCGEPLDSSALPATISALVGMRVHFADESTLVAEYLYDGNGVNKRQYDQLKGQVPCIAATMETLAAAGQLPVVEPENPVGFPVEPVFLISQHHVFVRYERPHLTKDVFEDVRVAAGVTLSPMHLSAILQAEVAYSFAGQTLVGVRGMYWAGRRDSEIGAWPGRAAGLVDLRVSF